MQPQCSAAPANPITRDPDDPSLQCNAWRRAHDFHFSRLRNERGEHIFLDLEDALRANLCDRIAVALWFHQRAAIPDLIRERYPGYRWPDGSGIVLTDDCWLTVAPSGRTQPGMVEWKERV